MSELIETVIIRAQQNFNVAGGLNPIQIEIKDDTVTNIFKKIQKCSSNTGWASFPSNNKKWHLTYLFSQKN